MSNPTETQHALYMFTRTFDKYKQESFINLKTFSDGLPFAFMLTSIQFFVGIIDELEQNPEKWTQKLANLKRILSKMENYVDTESQKILKINDLQLVEIAKNNSQQQILKFFQAVIAVLMQTPQKEDYIQRIMGLDERCQQALVIVVQNAMQQRISEQQDTNKTNQPFQQLNALQNENYILTQELNQLCKQNESLAKQNKDLQQKVHECQEEIEKARNLNLEMYMSSHSKASQIQRENSLIETLKKKMIQITRQHQLQISKSSDEIYHLKSKISHFKDIEDELMQRNKMQEEKLKNFTLAVQDERRRLEKIIDEKDSKLKKLQYELQISRNKIRELSEDIQVNDLNLRMELERKEVRFKQLQKQVKSRLTVEPPLELSSKKNSNQQPITPQKAEQNEEQLEYMKVQIQKLRNTNRQLQRQNLKLKKKSQKIQIVENEKKKLQKIILDVSKCRDSQIQMLVVSLYDLRNQNIRMHQIITQLKQKQLSLHN